MKKLLIVLALLSLVGCKPGEDKAISIAKKEITDTAKDPDSVKFRYMRFIKEKDYEDGSTHGFVCGQMNGKDSSGNYQGFSSFFIEIKMKSKSKYSTAVKYSIVGEMIYPSFGSSESESYIQTCGPNR